MEEISPSIDKKSLKEKLRAYARSSDQRLTLIFGAGASAGYSYARTAQQTPPVVTDLLDENLPVVAEVLSRHAFIKGQRTHIVRELGNFDNDLELYLSDIYIGDPDDALFSNLLFYLQDLFYTTSKNVSVENNSYKDLINLIRERRGKKEWSCISFNYDTILEKSIQLAGRGVSVRDFSSAESYAKHTPCVLKMHGGINFRYSLSRKESMPRSSAHDVFASMMNDSGAIENYCHIKSPADNIPDFYKTVQRYDSEKQHYYNLEAFDFPLMMIPIHGAIQPPNSYFRFMLEVAREEIEKSGLIIAIGYNFGDQFFSEALKGIDFSKKEVILVSRKSLALSPKTHRGFQNAQRIFGAQNMKLSDCDGFSDFVASLY